MTYPVQRKEPGKAGYIVGAILLFIGVAGGIALIAWGAYSVVDRVNHYQRVSVRTGGTVTFSDTGRYNAFYEAPGINDRRSDVPPLQIELVGPGGVRKVLSATEGSNGTDDTYSFGDHDGIRLTRFDIDQPGRYQVRVAGEPGTATGEIAFGRAASPRGSPGSSGASSVAVCSSSSAPSCSSSPWCAAATIASSPASPATACPDTAGLPAVRAPPLPAGPRRRPRLQASGRSPLRRRAHPPASGHRRLRPAALPLPPHRQPRHLNRSRHRRLHRRRRRPLLPRRHRRHRRVTMANLVRPARGGTQLIPRAACVPLGSWPRARRPSAQAADYGDDQ